ncbi:MAG: aldo/keto reductase [Pseudotabrizicola sp.]|uniref:aldo/keto reductase n=1 Tax=Pseudotabrizicola sp. TaxID=2939647 RepID=UPI002716CE91|nr:aldo/keto reductase [Pseudotabrizicola sp.]MDO8883105.1 aldo/keto reductase [Pseudotabrizicola sp.]MDP2081888.1 aldo/keto reductase [Pseudotabrizicola sp.]MDZ7575960.1 aldo/keto reductase [Pseudotabrizicola sp.]
MTVVKLNDGNRIPALGLGIWQIPADQTGRIVSLAIGMGYGLIDGAAIYGNEVGLGQGLRDAAVPREQVFVTTKIWNDRQGHDETLRAFDESVARLGLEPDLLLIHWPCPDKGLYLDTWRAMIRLREEGRVRSIGVSNFMGDHLERLIGDTGVTPVLNQIELHPGFQQVELRALHDRLGIATQCWTPLGKGQAFDAAPVQAIANRSGKTPAQVILRWHVQLGCSVIPRSTHEGRLAQNMDVFDFSLTEDEMAAMATLDNGTRLGPDPRVFS